MVDEDALDFNDREVVLRADLSTRDDRDCVWAPIRFIMDGPRSPRPGERVLLVDVAGAGTCMGEIVSLAGWAACVRPDWQTWSGPAMRPGRHAPRWQGRDRGSGAAP